MNCFVVMRILIIGKSDVLSVTWNEYAIDVLSNLEWICQYMNALSQQIIQNFTFNPTLFNHVLNVYSII
jgi:hypothetical protein